MPDFWMVGEDRGDDVGEEGVPLIGGEGKLPSQDVRQEDDAVGTVAQVGDPLFGLRLETVADGVHFLVDRFVVAPERDYGSHDEDRRGQPVAAKGVDHR
jgi:hypothetical protein